MRLPLVLLSFLSASILAAGADQPLREAVYGGAVYAGGEPVPLFDKGFLMYLHRPNRLQVFGPDTQLAFDFEVPCPGAGRCSAAAVATDGRASVAVAVGYWTGTGIRAGAIRMFDLKGNPVRVIETGSYQPSMICFDQNGDVWTAGWERDPVTNDTEAAADYNLVRKYSSGGKLLGEYLPRSLWPKRSSPQSAGRGYWRMCSASDRIGVMIHEWSNAGQLEWVEWDLGGKLLSRTALEDRWPLGRAFAGDGSLYALSRGDGRDFLLSKLDKSTGKWMAAADGLPREIHEQGAMLMGADGDHLVYRVSLGSNVRLVWARLGVPPERAGR